MPGGQFGADLGSAIVVGGSLVGLSLAIALARRGVAVTVLEQTIGAERGGTRSSPRSITTSPSARRRRRRVACAAKRARARCNATSACASP